jgi:hypothetical protein
MFIKKTKTTHARHLSLFPDGSIENNDQRPLRPTHGCDQIKVTERIAICRASFAISKERTRIPARFPLLKGPIRSKQCTQSRLVISHCLTGLHCSPTLK